ncbi:tetratricopeptide repeat protein [Microseira wollei]|uniref:Glycosyl transferase family 2 n=1 Tax=Microseira wollei NIES-4236 TaxID=2530354 RepID=A0AAV3X5B6_9CYAN|nr:tetratricopeptide repeat protein [Microseira wollei]GET37293.1 glycosyl transferase family 2 [Microseira wollei NIES-4236]
MAIIPVENPVINPSSFEPQNRLDGISGVMLIHNEAEFLSQVIETWIDAVDELAIAFNNCTDNTPQIIEEYQRKYSDKIRAFHYLHQVYSPNTKEQVESETNDVRSFCYYANFTISKTRYKTCVLINGDHVGIPARLERIYQYLKKNPIQNTALFFSGVNLWKKPNDLRYYVNVKDVALGDGDLAYWTVSPEHIFIKHPNPVWNIIRYQGLELYYVGWIFWHTCYLKKDRGQGNYGTYEGSLSQLREARLKETQLVLLEAKLKEKNKDLQNVSWPRFSLYFDFGSLPDVAGVDSTDEILQQAVEHQQANRLNQAEQAYLQVLETQPDRPEALYGLGIVAQQMGNPQMAQKWWSKALQVKPDSVKIWFSLGNLYQAQGQLKEAEEAYKRSLALAPDAAPIYNNLGYTLQQQQRWEEAIASYQKALELEPNCMEAEANLGNALHAQGKLSQEQLAHYAALNNQLGNSRKTAGDLQTAAIYYRQAIAMQPSLWEAHYNLGVVLQERGELEDAIASYQTALQLDPNHWETYTRLGKIYQAQNNLKEAIAAYRQGLSRINPHYAQAVAAYQPAGIVEEVPVTPPIPQGEVTVGAYQFPAIPPVADPQNPRPFWTVVIPVYNRTHYLLECLTSLLAQWSGEAEMEILVVDNASTPPLFELVNSIGGGVIRYYRHPQNLGALPNHNAGIALSRGQWIHILHDDDCVLPGFYSQLQQSLEGCPDSIGAAFTGFEYFNEKGVVVEKGEVASWFGEQSGIPQNFLRRIGVTCPLQVPAVVIRRAAHERLGGYHPKLDCAPEWELYKRIAVFYDWWYEPGTLARYRVHSHRMTANDLLSGTLAASLRQGLEISESYLPADDFAEITAQARSYNFNYCLARAAIPLKAGNLAGAWRMLQELLKIDRSPQSVAKLFEWLNQDKAAPLRDEIASQLVSMPWNDP